MSRVDVPTLQCDRCSAQTQDGRLMLMFRKLVHYRQNGSTEWDLCPECWMLFEAFMEGEGKS